MALHGTVADAFTKATVPDVFVTLMRQNSTVVDTAHVNEGTSYTRGIGRTKSTDYYMNVMLTASYRFTQKPKKQ